MDIRKAIANQHTPFVQRSRVAILTEKSAAAFEQCLAHFNLFHVLNYCMYEEYLKVSDMIDDLGMRKFAIKKHMKACEAVYESYTDFYHTHQSKETWFLMQDYGRLFYEKLEPKIMFLYIAVDNLLLKLGFKNHHLESRSICVEYMLIIIEDTWREFFSTYKKLSGLDFSSEFKQADMAEFARHYKEIHDNINKPNYKIIASLPNQSLYVINDPSCKAAMTAIRNFINEEDNMDQAAYQAIMYSDKIKEQYEEDMARMNAEKQKEETGDIAELLSQKYKVKRL